jgi:5-keto-L-gluconate epimerase
VRLSYAAATPEVTATPIAWVGASRPILTALAEIGYEGVEFQVRNPAGFDVAALTSEIGRAGLSVTGVSTGPAVAEDGLSLTSPDADTRRATAARLRSCLELAAYWGTHLAIGSIRGRLGQAPDRAVGLTWFRQGLEPLLDRAADLGSLLVLEPQSHAATDFFTTMEETLAFAAGYGPVLAVEADTFHMAAEERSVPAALVAAHRSGRLVHVQVGDTDRLAPGWGRLNWSDVLLTLDAVGYDGWLSVEAHQQPDSEAVARQGHAFLRSFAGDRRG